MISLLLGTEVISENSLHHVLFKVVPVSPPDWQWLSPILLLVSLTYKTSEDPSSLSDLKGHSSVWEREVLSGLPASPLAALHLVFMGTCSYSVGFWWVCFQLGSEEE